MLGGVRALALCDANVQLCPYETDLPFGDKDAVQGQNEVIDTDTLSAIDPAVRTQHVKIRVTVVTSLLRVSLAAAPSPPSSQPLPQSTYDLANAGDAEAQKVVGKWLWENGGSKADAVSWFQKAAAQNHMLAIFNMGVAYTLGAGIARDDVKAAAYFERAAKMGFGPGMYNYACCLQQANGVAKDVVLAAKLFSEVAHKGDPKGMWQWGLCLLAGEGTSVSRQRCPLYSLRFSSPNLHFVCREPCDCNLIIYASLS